MIKILQGFKAAIALLRKRKLMPTNLGSAELRAMGRNVLSQAIFSARTTQAAVLDEIREATAAMLEGRENLATGMLRLRELYGKMGYTAEGGFPQDAVGTVEPALAGTLQDLSSRRRRRLVIDTNYRIAANQAFVEKGMTPDAVRQYPAWELVRIGARRVPRGKVMTKAGLEDDPGEDWPSRFQAAGGEVILGRMLALKGSPVWQNLGDGAGGFTDTLGNAFPPFAYQSGMGIREVSRAEALEMGTLEEGSEAEVMRPDLAASLRTAGKGLSAETIALFKDTLQKDLATGRVSLADKVKAEAAKALRQYHESVDGK